MVTDPKPLLRSFYVQGSSEGDAEMSNSRLCPTGLTVHRGVDKGHVPNELFNRIVRCLPHTGLCNVRGKAIQCHKGKNYGDASRDRLVKPLWGRRG